MMEVVALMGAGAMGLAAARKILEAGRSLLVYDPSTSACANARQLGARLAASPVEASAESDLVLMFLPGPGEVELCVAGPQGLLTHARSNLVIVDLSTVDPATTVRMCNRARDWGVGYLDAPVLGRPGMVGHWTLVVGGDKRLLDRCRPVLEVLAANIFHVGPSGAGNKIKLLNQLMFGAINAMTAEMMAVSSRVGIPPGQLFEIITASRAGTVSNLFLELGQRVAQEDYDHPTFTVDLLTKDLHLAVEMARKHHAPPLLGGAIEFINETARSQGYGPKDTAVMWKCYQKIWGRGPKKS